MSQRVAARGGGGGGGGWACRAPVPPPPWASATPAVGQCHPRRGPVPYFDQHSSVAGLVDPEGERCGELLREHVFEPDQSHHTAQLDRCAAFDRRAWAMGSGCRSTFVRTLAWTRG
jgi:hypothetical protein